MKTHTHSVKLGDKTIKLETGKLAGQANAAVVASQGDNVVLATIVMGKEREDINYFPLFVEYQEKLYSGGKIKGSRWVKREGRPSDDSILTARLIDRSIRPLFPKDFKNEVQVVITTLSVDGENPVDTLSMFAVSAALAISDVPWDGPAGGLRVGQNKESGELIINPTYKELETSTLDLLISSTKDAIIMVEAGANEVTEATILEAFKLAQKQITPALINIDEFVSQVGLKKINFTPDVADQKLKELLSKDTKKDIQEIVKAKANLERHAEDSLLDKLFDSYAETYSKKDIVNIVSDLVKAEARRLVLKKDTRVDGRKFDQIRSITSEVSILPRTHGSAIFNRGETQSLSITTLASPAMEQIIEGAEGEETKRYIHHYYMPPYTVGETGRLGWPSRREVGHGALAERALEPMIPPEESFPYTIRVVSEIMSSNGSTSMAAVCGSTLSLMDAGVKIIKPIAGIAMGLVTDGKKYVVLSDILGFEDHTGDMDFKVAGSKDGITAMQMDVKVKGVPYDVLENALKQAQTARLKILESMLAVLPEPKEKLSAYAPKILTIKVPVERIGEIIGPGGKIIRAIIADSGAQVDINDEGQVFISSEDDDSIQKAKAMVEGIVREVQPGEEFDGKVVRIVDFGAFVEILPSKDGLVHVSNMNTKYVKNPNEIVSVGDAIHVRVIKVDELGRINLTMLTPEEEQQAKENRPQSNYNKNQNQRPRRDNRRY